MKRELEALKKYFSGRPDVAFAFLFGSHAKERGTRISDWDIGVYFRPKDPDRIEWEEIGATFPQEDQIWDDLIDILRTDNVDLVVLNRAPSTLAVTAIGATALDIKERKTYLDFMLVVTSEAEDFNRTVREYSDIYWRSSSISEEDKNLIIKRIIFLDSELRDVLKFQNLQQVEYENDSSIRRDVERWVENLINATIDVAKIILASQKKKAPATYKEILQDACFSLGLPDLGKRLSKFAGLSNILAHEYLDIRWKRIEEFIKEGQGFLPQFLQTTREFIK